MDTNGNTKELLIKDLSSRLPYGVKIELTWWGMGEGAYTNTTLEPDHIEQLLKDEDGDIEIKPYLFPLTSMTEEQRKEMQEIIGNPNYACIMRKTGGLELWLESVDTDPTIWLDTIFEVQDYLNKNHFDYRNLIDKNLAIDCTNLNIY